MLSTLDCQQPTFSDLFPDQLTGPCCQAEIVNLVRDCTPRGWKSVGGYPSRTFAHILLIFMMVCAYSCRFYPCLPLAVPLGMRLPPVDNRGSVVRCRPLSCALSRLVSIPPALAFFFCSFELVLISVMNPQSATCFCIRFDLEDVQQQALVSWVRVEITAVSTTHAKWQVTDHRARNLPCKVQTS